MKYIFGITTDRSKEYKNFVSDINKLLSDRSNKVKLVHAPNSILSYLAIDKYDAIIIDWTIMEGEFDSFQRQLKKLNNIIPLVIISSDSGISREVFNPCISLFRVIPYSNANEKIHNILKDISQYYKLIKELSPKAKEYIKPNGFNSIIGNSKLMLQLYAKLSRIAQTDFTTLILGNSGTGKELITTTIHDLSPRNKQNLVSLNCAAIPETLQESELFGYEKGAFTGADNAKVGKFELANNGTLFLDEIGDMSLDLQAKLLRVLEDKVFTRLGGIKEQKMDVRYIAATNRNLEGMLQNNKFRSDLFYRLNVIPITLPALVDRDADIVLLCLSLIGKMLEKSSLTIKSISWELINTLKELPLNGNIRELENILTRILFYATSTTLNKKILDNVDIASDPIASTIDYNDAADGKVLPIWKIEKTAIENALKKYRRNLSKVATVLEISRSALYRKLKKYDLDDSDV
ncbi:MAG: sigma-54 dependent transcriptional regulator [Candidatus Neomarinimicrobiota bacterium]